MPRHDGPGPGRPRKFKKGDLAHHERLGYVVIVDYINEGHSVYYRVVRVQHPYNGAPYGEAIWIKSYKLRILEADEVPFGSTRRHIAGIYAANQRLGDRGCMCNCCVHEAIPKGQVRKDGSFKWEEVEDE